MMTRKQLLLICLAEELGEVAKECIKGVRFGTDCDWYQGRTNHDRACEEWSQVSALMGLLEIEYGIKFEVREEDAIKKVHSFEQYYEHSVQMGMVEPREEMS